MDLTASAIKPGRRSLNRTSMDVRRARGAIKDPSHTKSRDVLALFITAHAWKDGPPPATFTVAQRTGSKRISHRRLILISGSSIILICTSGARRRRGR